MSLFSNKYIFTFILFSSGVLVPFVFSAPTADSPYNKFINFLVKNNCSMPPSIELPIPPAENGPFTYLANLLKECQTLDATSETDEAKYLCTEIFDVIHNITCYEYEALPKIQTKPLSSITCKDFEAMKDIFPEENDYLSKRLVDGTLCKLLCSPDKYDSLCKTLLWSYDLQAKIRSKWIIYYLSFSLFCVYILF